VDTIRDFDSAFAVATADNELGALVMNAHCDLLKRVEFPDGSSKETMSCQVTDAEGWGEFGGTFPSTAFVDSGGECIWFSDYWANHPTDPQEIYGDSYLQVVTPSGKAHATVWFSADPSTGEDCFGPLPADE
jgi:hypothetical protein